MHMLVSPTLIIQKRLKCFQASWDIFRKSKNLLRQSVEVYLFERLCGTIASGELAGPPPFEPAKLPASNSLIQVNIKPEIEDFLDDFERICSGRSKLVGHAQMACFYSLLLFSISKSLLIDAYSTRTTCDDVSPWNETFALRITSAFKALVGVFSWSSKSDVMLQSGPDIMKSGINWALITSQEMVKIKSWKSRGFKSSKDFLLALGSFRLPNGAYNGFFIQKFGFESVPQLPTVSPKPADEPSYYRNDKTPVESDNFGSRIRSSRSTLTPAHGFRTLKFTPDLEPESPETLAGDSDFQEHSSSSCSRRDISVEESIHSSASSPRQGPPNPLTFINHDGHSPHNSQLGRRRGPLDEESLKKVREIRKIGACWNCWVLKVPCSEGQPDQPCGRCKRGIASQVCSRAAFTTIL
ncbi:hypothetical protein BGZ60DRAFT_160618 [Tricladium varicosporioides]|nr:hypothetical protein BGZ60DRAFT_160618 [Hymenoscyphus varicosporioides]